MQILLFQMHFLFSVFMINNLSQQKIFVNKNNVNSHKLKLSEKILNKVCKIFFLR